jgi:antitoxin MazE
VKTRIVRIGNSQGIRIPKLLLEQAKLPEVVELQVEGSTLVITAACHPRAGWADAFAEMHRRGDDMLIDTPAPTAFEDTEWKWPSR